MTYNDNVFLTPRDPKADYIRRITPMLYLSRPLARGLFDMSYGVDQLHYSRQDQLSATSYLANANLQYDLTERLNLQASNSFNYTPDVLVRDNDAYQFFSSIGGGAVQDPNLLARLQAASVTRARRLQHSIGGRFTYQVSQDFSADLDLRQDAVYFDNVVFSRSRVAGLGGNYKRQLSGRDTIFAGARVSGGARQMGVTSRTDEARGTWERIFSDDFVLDTRLALSRTRENGTRRVPARFGGTALSSGSAARSTDNARLDFVGVVALPKDIRLRAGLGAAFARSRSGGGQSTSHLGPNFTVGLDKPLPFRNGTLTLDFDRALISNYVGDVTTQQVRSTFTYEFSPNVQMQTSLWRVTQDTASGTNANTRSWGLDNALARRLGEHASLRFSWSHLNQFSAGATGPSARNLFTISLSADI